MGPYWAIGCLSEIARAVAIVGVVGSIGLAPFTMGISLIGIPVVFLYILFAQFLRLMIDIGHSTRGTHEILKARSGGRYIPPDPNGPWETPKLKRDRRPSQYDDDEFAPPRTRR